MPGHGVWAFTGNGIRNMHLKSMVVAVMVTAASFVAPALAQDGQALTPGIVEQFDLASKLTNYGMERSDPILLLAAARLMRTVAPEVAKSQPGIGAADLIAKAREMAGSNPAVTALADEIDSEVSRGLCYGPGTVYGCF